MLQRHTFALFECHWKLFWIQDLLRLCSTNISEVNRIETREKKKLIGKFYFNGIRQVFQITSQMIYTRFSKPFIVEQSIKRNQYIGAIYFIAVFFFSLQMWAVPIQKHFAYKCGKTCKDVLSYVLFLFGRKY